MKKLILNIVAALFITVYFTLSSVYANGYNRVIKVNALGVTGEYSHSNELNDGGCHLSYRYGFAHVIAGMVGADVGYRFQEESINSRLGVAGMFMFIGLETGYTMSFSMVENNEYFNNGDESFAQGWYAGLTGVIPDKDFILLLSLGGNFFFMNHEHEFYIRLSFLVNFSGYY